ncbi:hypothetical protein V6N13_005790 [Hibiscus sabdariffa]
MGGQVDGETTLPSARGPHDDDEFGLVLIGVTVVGWRGLHPSPPWTAVQGKKRVKERRMKRVERRENRWTYNTEQNPCACTANNTKNRETESNDFLASGFHRLHPSVAAITAPSADKAVNFSQPNRKKKKER